MKNLTIKLRTIFILTLFFHIFYSCNKGTSLNNVDNLREQNNIINIFCKSFSRALILDVNLREQVKSKSISSSSNSFDEILLRCFFDENNNESRFILDSLIEHYANGTSSQVIIEQLLSLFPTLSLKIPDKFASIDWDVHNLAKTPSIVYYDSTYQTYYNGGRTDPIFFNDEKSIYYIALIQSETYLAIDHNYNILKNRLNLYDIIGQINDSCKKKLDNYIQSISDPCRKIGGYTVIKTKKLYNLLNDCQDPSPYEDTNASPPSQPLCTTTPIRDVDDNHYTYNYWEGIKILSETAAKVMANQPFENTYLFVLNWVHPFDGEQLTHSRRWPISKGDLYIPAKYKWVPDLSDCDDDDILAGDTNQCGYWELVKKAKLKPYSLSINGYKSWFFTKSDSRWYLDNVGKYFPFQMFEIDETSTVISTSGENGKTTTKSFELSLPIPMFEKIATEKWVYSSTHKVKWSTEITALSVIELGSDIIDWCDQESTYLEYPVGGFVYLNIGCDVLEY